ncbi:Os01g0188650 [Oryza sativa Japonica Group]|uniref:Os01g0188650 protein n=1 Tax=Oryza sativa subsp. japonica TaxID=39947 RepID=A0A0P0UZN9_ORYSJ|nr:Os01g0188650 [Oryza sativa Japonica Group]
MALAAEILGVGGNEGGRLAPAADLLLPLPDDAFTKSWTMAMESRSRCSNPRLSTFFTLQNLPLAVEPSSTSARPQTLSVEPSSSSQH